MEGVGKSTTKPMSQIIKMVKMLKIARVFRIFRFSRELSVLALMIVDSLKSLMWALLMLIMIMYVFAIIFTTSATAYVKEESDTDAAGVAATRLYFGSVFKTCYYLIQAMLGGIIGIAFTVLAVFNVITGVFVNKAFDTARQQREYVEEQQMKLKHDTVAELRSVFKRMDLDQNGVLTYSEIESCFQHPDIQPSFRALGMEFSDTARLFELLDVDGSGGVNIDEFLEGCLRLRGEAR
eukprot:CAMPEP_0117617546 /NCGR_PEP_ID=MMETSP0784-20121206/85647_1 /TAXON_ID=39447 /ORGANISM="" /LENGTH=236 /DNA_ID=CAMNT_0005421389 /DNA_START=50 /DNA_END=757 /DNA_ORIENTATION=+